MKRTANLISGNFKKYDPLQIESYVELDGFKAMKKAFELGSDGIIAEVDASGLMGRGGAAYPTGRKLKQSKDVTGDVKYLICNADEGEPATFKDRYLLEYDPYSIIEGMVITAYTVGATHGYIYIREEYSYLHSMLRAALEQARENNYLGDNILGKGFSFDIDLFSGAGAYICGEGSSLIESMEGKSGRPRIKPPYTKVSGLYQEPTLVHNVETLTTIKAILFHGADVFAKYGTEESKGTKLISLCGNVNNPGVYEVPFGITIREIIDDLGGGVKDGLDVKFLQLGGASGAIMPKSLVDIPYAYETFQENGLDIGSGAVLVADNTNRIIDFLDSVQTFFLHESCGKCTPCREGNRQLSNILGRMKEGVATDKDVASVERIANIMKYASFCGLGKTAPTAVLTAIRYFSDELFSKGDVYERM